MNLKFDASRCKRWGAQKSKHNRVRAVWSPGTCGDFPGDSEDACTALLAEPVVCLQIGPSLQREASI